MGFQFNHTQKINSMIRKILYLLFAEKYEYKNFLSIFVKTY